MEITHIPLEDHRYFITFWRRVVSKDHIKIKMELLYNQWEVIHPANFKLRQIVKEADHTPTWTEGTG